MVVLLGPRGLVVPFELSASLARFWSSTVAVATTMATMARYKHPPAYRTCTVCSRTDSVVPPVRTAVASLLISCDATGNDCSVLH